MSYTVLTAEECHRLLASTDIGRLAVVAGGYPEVFPINYALARERVLIRTDPGTKLAHSHFARVSIQVDDLDPETRTGWSVLVKGVVHEMQAGDHHAEELHLAAREITPWVGGVKGHVLVITPVSFTGRRLTQDS